MRADRLISIVMLLQTHEKMTADELSKEMEVSQRTIYRDITALNVAGIPVYTERGPGGGIALVDSYRTSLTGISEEEAKALFMLSIPEALIELGMGEKLKIALLKLAAALPYAQRSVMTETQQRIYLDSTTWIPTEEPAIHLGTIHEAIWQDKLLNLVYQGSFDTKIDVEIAPMGLISKMNVWYLVGLTGGYLRVIKVKDVIEVRISEQELPRDNRFNLISAWMEWCRDYQERRPVYMVKIKMTPDLSNRIGLYLGESVRFEIIEAESSDDRNWKFVIIYYENFFHARESILSLGRAVEVLEPEALKLSVIDFAKQIIDFYRGK
jgi:predicted DNA-binding transcriptional regulator YafY